jgi:hypothetical protein
MSAPVPAMPVSGRDAWRLAALVLLRVLVSMAMLFAAYFLIPTRRSGTGSDVPWLILELFVFGVVVAIQVPAIVNAKYPVVRAVETMAILITVYLLIFSRVYLANSLYNASSFSTPLDNVTALYFTVTVFATVGFGDIVAATNSMRLLVTLQMMLNLVLLGLVIRLVTSAARRGVARRGAASDLGEPPQLAG